MYQEYLEIFNSIAIVVMILFVVLLPFTKYKLIKMEELVVFVLIFLVPYMWVNFVQPKWQRMIRDDIEAANYCITDKDCAAIYSYSMFCDNIHVNQREASRILSEVQSYKTYAIFGEDACTNVLKLAPKCNKNKKCELPSYYFSDKKTY